MSAKAIWSSLVLGALLSGVSLSCTKAAPPPEKPGQAVPETAEAAAGSEPEEVGPKPIEDELAGQVEGSHTQQLEPELASAPSIALAAEPGQPFDAQGLASSKIWPFYKWDRAVSYTFNAHAPGPGMQLRIYSESQGWHRERVKGPTLTARQSKEALRLLSETEGGMEVSKCAFPRHGIVFFAGEVPVGSINVCFECGDILIWPAYRKDKDWEERKYKHMGRLMKSYDRIFPAWEKLFALELGLAADWKAWPNAKASQVVGEGR